jgi:hypothetical protein
VKAGSTFVVRVVDISPHGVSTGSLTQLQKRVAGKWKSIYLLESALGRPRAVPIAAVKAEAGVGLRAGQPERLRLPRRLSPGRYRLVKPASLHGQTSRASGFVQVARPGG